MKYLFKDKPIVKVFTFISLVFVVTIMIAGASLAATSKASNEFQPNMSSRSEVSQESIDSYCKKIYNFNKELINEKKSDIKTTITLSEPISFEELEEYTAKNNINISELIIRGQQPDGTRTTLFAGEDINRELVLSTIEGNGDTFVGIVAIQGYVSAQKLKNVMDDSLTYLADTSNDVQQVKGQADDDNSKTCFVNHIAWYLEDLGIGGYNYKQK